MMFSYEFCETSFLQNTSRRLFLFVICLTVSFCREVLYTFVRTFFCLKNRQKITILPSFHFANTFYTLHCECIYTLGQNMQGNEKVANRKLGKVGNLGNLRKVIPSFLISEFSILPYSQNWKIGYKNLGKRFPRFPKFLSFWPGSLKSHWNTSLR